MSSSLIRVALGWVCVIAVLAVTAWFGWKALYDSKPEEGKGGGGGRPPATVIVKPVTEKDAVQMLNVTGTLRAVRRAEVAAQEAAAVESLNVDEGDSVEKGDVLAKLDGRRLEAQIQEAEAALTSAKAELSQRQAEKDRAIQDEAMMSGLWEQRAVAEREFLDSVREMKVAKARANAAEESIQAAEKRLELFKVRRNDLEVRAPFKGRVVAHHTEVGEWVNAGAPVVTLVSTGEAEAWLQLPERHVRLLREIAPDSVEISLPGSNDVVSSDKLTVIPEVDGRSRRFTVIAHVNDPDNKLTPGSSVEASVALGKPEKHLVVMADAVLTSYSGTYVFVPQTAEGGPAVAKRVPVDVMFQRDGEAYLKSQELKSGDQVIVEGNERLFPGSPVDPKSWAETRGDAASGANKETAKTE